MKKQSLQKENKYIDQDLSTFKEKQGLKLKPRNMKKYKMPEVDSVVFFNPSFIEKILQKKLSRKLTYYLEYIMTILADDDASGETIREALNSLARYRSIVEYKYEQYLEQNTLEQFYKQMAMFENELKMRLLYQSFDYEEVEEKRGKAR